MDEIHERASGMAEVEIRILLTDLRRLDLVGNWWAGTIGTLNPVNERWDRVILTQPGQVFPEISASAQRPDPPVGGAAIKWSSLGSARLAEGSARLAKDSRTGQVFHAARSWRSTNSLSARFSWRQAVAIGLCRARSSGMSGSRRASPGARTRP